MTITFRPGDKVNVGFFDGHMSLENPYTRQADGSWSDRAGRNGGFTDESMSSYIEDPKDPTHLVEKPEPTPAMVTLWVKPEDLRVDDVVKGTLKAGTIQVGRSSVSYPAGTVMLQEGWARVPFIRGADAWYQGSGEEHDDRHQRTGLIDHDVEDMVRRGTARIIFNPDTDSF